VDWTRAHHERGAHIYGVKNAYDYVARRTSLFQTVITAVGANRKGVDGWAVDVQAPDVAEAERAYVLMTRHESYPQRAAGQNRLLEVLASRRNRLAYRKRTAIAGEVVREIEEEGHFPAAQYAFDPGVLPRELTRVMESAGKHWGSEIACSRHITWAGQWRRVDEVGVELRMQHPESFRPLKVLGRHGQEREDGALTKGGRWKKYGRKRFVIAHERADLSDTPRFFLRDALHGESGRVIETWHYRWPSEVFHEFSKQVSGLEAAQGRKEEAVTRHFRLRCVAQSFVQRAAASGRTSERFEFADDKATVSQKGYTITREALAAVLHVAQGLLAQGHTCDQVLEVLMPA
jgi:hypothetical protein